MDKKRTSENIIKENVPKRIAMVQLAEEASELAQAAIKYYRLGSDILPTPLNEEEISEKLTEELTDVMVAACIAGVKQSGDLFDKKMDRWAERIEEALKQKEETGV